MNRRVNTLAAMTAVAGLLVLILDSRTAISGAQDGVMLCIRTVIPSLFPFFFLSGILSSSLMGRRIPLLRPIGKLCRIPDGAEYILICGLLGGYPVGAQSISDALTSGNLSEHDARRMIAFCNNCGPAFLFGMAAVLFDSIWAPWLLLAIHVTSALIVGLFLPGSAGTCNLKIRKALSPVAALNQAIRSMAGVCGWVVLFRVLIAFLERWFLWYLPAELQVTIIGALEISNGCIALASVDSMKLQFILCSGFLGFGGLCVTMQTYFAARNVDKRLYFPGKVLQSLISMTLGCMIFGEWWFVFPALIGAILTIFLKKIQNRCGNHQLIGV